MSNIKSTNPNDEGRLVFLLKQGNEQAFQTLIQKYQGKLLGVAYGITLDREESRDIVQEVFISVYRNIHNFKEKASLSTWLHRITINQCLNWKRRWKRRFRWRHQPLEKEEGGDYPELGSENYSPEAIHGKNEIEKIFREKLAELSEESRSVFVLKEFEGLSYDEIAEILNIKRGTVSSRLFYVRKRLKKTLEEYLGQTIDNI